MSIDWNWFFSSFSQCSAALIGIIAAFIISKLLSESEKSDVMYDSFNKLILLKDDLINRINTRYFDWYNKVTIQYSSKIKSAIKSGEFDNLEEQECLEKLYSIDSTLFNDASNVVYLKELIEKSKPEKTNFRESTMLSQSIIDDIIPNGLWDKLTEERDLITSLKIESENLIQNFKVLKSAVKSTSKKTTPIKVTIYILSIGFIFAVIYPLHFMPIMSNEIPEIDWSLSLFFELLFTLKGFLLITLTIVIEGIFIFFLLLIRKINNNYSELDKLISNDFMKISHYSKYF